MARNRFYGSDDPPGGNDPQAAAFAQRLNRHLLQRGWSQMDLVRKVQPLLPEGVKFERHLVSTWMRGKHLPSPVNLDLVAQALGVSVDELVPAGAAVIVKAGDRDAKLTMSPTGSARIKLDMELPAEDALQILAIANRSSAGHRGSQ